MRAANLQENTVILTYTHRFAMPKTMKLSSILKAFLRRARSLRGAPAFLPCPFAAAKKIARSFEPCPEGLGCDLFARSAALIAMETRRPGADERKALRLALKLLRDFAPAAGALADACSCPGQRFCQIYRPDGSPFFICPFPEPLQSSVEGLKLGWPEWEQRKRLLQLRNKLAEIHTAIEQLPDSALAGACAILAAALNGIRAPEASFAHASLAAWSLQMRLLLERSAVSAASLAASAPSAAPRPKARSL